jgi:carboxypeptidase C (cathepsin A)
MSHSESTATTVIPGILPGAVTAGERTATLTTATETFTYRVRAETVTVTEEHLDEGYRGLTPIADVFTTSYIRVDDEGQPNVNRPVIFTFNGGPGSSTVWLHLGLFGPRLVFSGDVDTRTPPPYGIVDNPESLLADADLVFIDPMSTGFTRAADGVDPARFHGFTGDRDLVGQTILRWLADNGRWTSPKFLAGESYGTTRATALAGWLASRHGVAFNGLILISTVSDFATIRFTPGNDAPYVYYLPTYAADAWYHGLHPGRELEDVVADAEEFARTDYRSALERGHRLPAAERDIIAARIATLVGVSAEYVLRSNLRIEHKRYFAELLRDAGKMVGRLDGRITAPSRDMMLEAQENDPANDFIRYPYTAVINGYLRDELGCSTTLDYEVYSDRVQPWSYSEFENTSVYTGEDLGGAMRQNPDMAVYCAFGYFDGSTPFAASEHVLAHLPISTADYSRIERHYYKAGHMMYVHEPSRLEQSRHIAQFVRSAATAV